MRDTKHEKLQLLPKKVGGVPKKVGGVPKIAIIGRPNVGKSTLFNRIVGRRQAIVDDIPGVTRDRQYGMAKHEGVEFQVIDTGGFIPGGGEHVLSRAVRGQVDLALEEADLIYFVVDGRFGITPAEEEIAKGLYRQSLPVQLVVNKLDHSEQEPLMADFLALGFKDPLGVSAETGRGLKELLGAHLDLLAKSGFESEEQRCEVKLAIAGQPNVGKSTLLNALLGEKRAVVHHETGTTVDPLPVQVKRGDRLWEFVDTAGIRRRRSTKGKVEKVGVLKALESIRLSHIVLLLLDATQGVHAQDLKILNEAQKRGRAVAILLNKWDLMPSGSKLSDFKKDWLERYKRAGDLPFLALSAKSGRGVGKVWDLAEEVHDNFWRRISTGELNRVFQKALKAHPPNAVSGQLPKLSYLTQSRTAPPRFVIFCNKPELVDETYLRYLERKFRKEFSFSGAPLQFSLRRKN